MASQMKKYDKANILRELNHSQQTAPSNLDSNQKALYDSQVPIRIRQFNREPSVQYLNLKVSLVNSQKGAILHLELTDEANQYSLSITLASSSTPSTSTRVTSSSSDRTNSCWWTSPPSPTSSSRWSNSPWGWTRRRRSVSSVSWK